MIDFLDELGNFKQRNFYSSKCKFFLHFTTTDPIYIELNFMQKKIKNSFFGCSMFDHFLADVCNFDSKNICD